ncbi:hypothetical protein FPV67DRAFT_1444786 [Lyophyllum atratum]|nr:hypothetical protein FPV67DRAFT_1444786 [Lyophyllum atratum]
MRGVRHIKAPKPLLLPRLHGPRYLGLRSGGEGCVDSLLGGGASGAEERATKPDALSGGHTLGDDTCSWMKMRMWMRAVEEIRDEGGMGRRFRLRRDFGRWNHGIVTQMNTHTGIVPLEYWMDDWGRRWESTTGFGVRCRSSGRCDKTFEIFLTILARREWKDLTSSAELSWKSCQRCLHYEDPGAFFRAFHHEDAGANHGQAFFASCEVHSDMETRFGRKGGPEISTPQVRGGVRRTPAKRSFVARFEPIGRLSGARQSMKARRRPKSGHDVRWELSRMGKIEQMQLGDYLARR